MPDEFLTIREFSQWAVGLDKRLDKLDKHGETLTSIEVHLAVLNGRTATNTAKIDGLEGQVKAVARQDKEIEDTVKDIHDHGCDKKKEHEQVIAILGGAGVLDGTRLVTDAAGTVRPQFRLPDLTPKQKVGAGVGIGALLIPAVSDLFKLANSLVAWLQQIHGKV